MGALKIRSLRLRLRYRLGLKCEMSLILLVLKTKRSVGLRVMSRRWQIPTAPLNKLVSLTWLLWALTSFRRFTLHYITPHRSNVPTSLISTCLGLLISYSGPPLLSSQCTANVPYAVLYITFSGAQPDTNFWESLAISGRWFTLILGTFYALLGFYNENGFI